MEVTQKIIENYGEECIKETSYSKGMILYFDTNMLHKRKNTYQQNAKQNISRVAIVVELMESKRLSIIGNIGPIGGKRILKG